MPAGDLHPTGDHAPLALVAVEPRLLATALTRLLEAGGWRVGDLHGVKAKEGTVDAVLQSQEAAGYAPAVDAQITVVLPDPAGLGGFVHYADGREEPLGAGRASLEAVFALIARGRSSPS